MWKKNFLLTIINYNMTRIKVKNVKKWKTSWKDFVNLEIELKFKKILSLSFFLVW